MQDVVEPPDPWSNWAPTQRSAYRNTSRSAASRRQRSENSSPHPSEATPVPNLDHDEDSEPPRSHQNYKSKGRGQTYWDLPNE